MERVELHCHSKYSKMDGLAHPDEIVRFARKKGMPAVAITDHGSVRAFPEFAREAESYEYDVKPIFGIEAYIVDDYDKIEHCPKTFAKSTIYHCTVLLKNAKGKNTLYHMISQAEKRKDKKGRDIFSLRALCGHRDDFLLGSGCEAGLLYRAVINGESDDEIKKIARCFDFIEVQPHLNNKYLIEAERYSHIRTEQDLIDINLKLIALGEEMGILVAATGDVHYLNREDLPSRKVLMAYRGMTEDDDTDLHFRTTKEMLEAFAYLPEEKAEEIVVTKPL